MKEVFSSVKAASRMLLKIPKEERSTYLEKCAACIRKNQEYLLAANQKDLASASNLSLPMIQRLKLDAGKIENLCLGIDTLASLEDPVGKTISNTVLDDGLTLSKVSVPIGVLGIIFESRPDVIPQILSLALRSGNAVILKGGKESFHTNSAFMELITLLNTESPAFPKDWAILLQDRESAMEMLNAPESIDLIIPRGSNALVAEIMSKSKVPVLGHADGVCHIYVDVDADQASALSIIKDAKTQYPAACNAVEMVLVHQEIQEHFIPKLISMLEAEGVTVKYPVPASEWHTEYSDLTLGVLSIPSIEKAIEHINCHGSHHTDVIITKDQESQELFLRSVDSACVFVNCSSRFADGQRFGLGAEVGIATGKLHARGPVGIEGLLTTQYRLVGEGQLVSTYTGANAKPFLHK